MPRKTIYSWREELKRVIIKYSTILFFYLFFVVLPIPLIITYYYFDMSPESSLLISSIVSIFISSILTYLLIKTSTDKPSLLLDVYLNAKDPDFFKVEFGNKVNELIAICDNMKIAFGIRDKVKLKIIDLPYINAMVVRDKDGFCLYVSDEALKYLDYYELEAMLAHEFAHMRNKDYEGMIKVLMVASVILILSQILIRVLPRLWWYGSLKRKSGEKRKGNINILDLIIIFLIIVGFILALLSPFIVRDILSKISKAREFKADADAVFVTKNPNGMINCLMKVYKNVKMYYDEFKPVKTVGALYFLNIDYDTHPPVLERIKKIKEISGNII